MKIPKGMPLRANSLKAQKPSINRHDDRLTLTGQYCELKEIDLTDPNKVIITHTDGTKLKYDGINKVVILEIKKLMVGVVRTRRSEGLARLANMQSAVDIGNVDVKVNL
jgi:hypothetical protein